MPITYNAWTTHKHGSGYWYRDVDGSNIHAFVIRQYATRSGRCAFRYEVQVPGVCDDGTPGIQTLAWGIVGSAPRARKIVDNLLMRAGHKLGTDQ